MGRLIEPQNNYAYLLQNIIIDPNDDIGRIMNVDMWNTYIQHIVLPRFKAIESAQPTIQEKAIKASLRFNDIHAICMLIMNEIFKIDKTIKIKAHEILMQGGYIGRSTEYMYAFIEFVAKQNKLLALAMFTCLGVMDTFIFVPDVPIVYWKLWLIIKNA